MPTNYPGPYEVRYTQVTADGLVHTTKVNCIVVGGVPAAGADPTTITLVSRGASVALNVAANGFWDVFANDIPASTACASYSFWHYPSAGATPVFITAGALTSPNGQALISVVLNSQITKTFRTALGNIMKVVTLDACSGGSEARIPLSPSDALAAYVLGSTGWLIGRDDAFPIAALNDSRGQNEDLFKQRHR